jgi:hypothetical protein
VTVGFHFETAPLRYLQTLDDWGVLPVGSMQRDHFLRCSTPSTIDRQEQCGRFTGHRAGKTDSDSAPAPSRPMNVPANPSPPESPGAISAEQFRQAMALLTAIAKSAPAHPDPPKYLTVQEAASYCRVAVQTIYNNRRYIERMPGVRKLLFTRESLDRWLATRRQKRR